MIFGFRLRVLIRERFSSDEQKIEIDLAAPIGRVTLQAFPGQISFRQAQEMMFSGRGYESFEEAERAGQALKNAIRLAAVEVGNAIDVGQDVVSGGPGQVLVEDAAQRGIQLLPDVHGLQVYEETGTPTVLSLRGEGMVLTPLASFTDALHAQAAHAADLDPKRALACDLFAESRSETSPKSRHLTLVTALEVLSDRLERSGLAAQLVEEFRHAIRQAASEVGQAERAQLDSLLGTANDLRRESIGAAIRRLATSIEPARLRDARDAEPTDLARMSTRPEATSCIPAPQTKTSPPSWGPWRI